MLRRSKESQLDALIRKLEQLEAEQGDPATRSWRNHLRLAKVKRNLMALDWRGGDKSK